MALCATKAGDNTPATKRPPDCTHISPISKVLLQVCKLGYEVRNALIEILVRPAESIDVIREFLQSLIESVWKRLCHYSFKEKIVLSSQWLLNK